MIRLIHEPGLAASPYLRNLDAFPDTTSTPISRGPNRRFLSPAADEVPDFRAHGMADDAEAREEDVNNAALHGNLSRPTTHQMTTPRMV